jgi:hypothetical protein
MRNLLFIIVFLSSLSLAQDDYFIYDQAEINGHPGYLTAWAIQEPMDKVVLIAAGFDVKNEKHPVDELTGDFAPVVEYMGELGWTVIFFDYVDGATDLKDNGDNLADLIRYLDTQAAPDYHLALIGGSMGGIVVRTMFVQENDDMGVETYVSVDSPHWGVYPSAWVDGVVSGVIGDLNFKAGSQMYNGHEDYEEHYGWMQSVESSLYFKRNVNRPMDTCAITLSDGSDNRVWVVNAFDEAIHNKYYPVASYIDLEGLRSTYMPFHSTAYLLSDKTKSKHKTGFSKYRYKKSKSRYFDTIIPNERDEHQAPEYAVRQAIDFVVLHGPDGEAAAQP